MWMCRADPTVGQYRRQSCSLLPAQTLYSLANPVLARRPDPIHTGGELDDIEIYLQRAALAPDLLQQQRQRQLKPLAGPVAPRPEEQVLGSLLGQGTGPAQGLTGHRIPYRLLQLLEIHTRVEGKTLILGRHYRQLHVQRYGIQLNPLVTIAIGITLRCGDATPDQPGPERRVHITQRHCHTHRHNQPDQQGAPKHSPQGAKQVTGQFGLTVTGQIASLDAWYEREAVRNS